jgi:hypothetical protein
MQLRDLERRYISRYWAEAAQLRALTHDEGKDLFKGRNNGGDYSGILIPYFIPGVNGPVTYRLRRHNPEIEAGTGKAKAKYISHPGDRNRIYIPPFITAEHLADTNIPISLVEGEFKAIALRRLAGDAPTDTPRFIPIGLSGIWNWRGVVGKENNENGARVSVKGPLPDLDLINWVNRDVDIAFDQDEEKTR